MVFFDGNIGARFLVHTSNKIIIFFNKSKNDINTSYTKNYMLKVITNELVIMGQVVKENTDYFFRFFFIKSY